VALGGVRARRDVIAGGDALLVASAVVAASAGRAQAGEGAGPGHGGAHASALTRHSPEVKQRDLRRGQFAPARADEPWQPGLVRDEARRSARRVVREMLVGACRVDLVSLGGTTQP
jgi:hypothetical protein